MPVAVPIVIIDLIHFILILISHMIAVGNGFSCDITRHTRELIAMDSLIYIIVWIIATQQHEHTHTAIIAYNVIMSMVLYIILLYA